MEGEDTMKTRYIVIPACFIVLLSTVMVMEASAYSLMLPESPPAPTLPYLAEQDHYSGPASAQMILNSCPSVAARHNNSQEDIYSSILLHNTEPTAWFSAPSGIAGALSDPVFSPCGHWVDYSSTDKTYVLGRLLYWMDNQKYLTPVSIGASEHWVTVIGFQTDIKPTLSGTVTLQNIFFYDPLPGNVAAMWVSGTAWLSGASYWSVPLNMPGSAWHNKYIAIIEPPTAGPIVIARKWMIEGRVLPGDKVEKAVRDWLTMIRETKLISGPFEILKGDTGIVSPILVKAKTYSYYLVQFRNSRIEAIFNAYDGSFEELRVSQKERRPVMDAQKIKTSIAENMRVRGMKLVETSTPEMRYDPAVAAAGRFSPVWETQAVVQDKTGKRQKMPIVLDREGRILKGM
jgi:hypothetical protein